MTAALRVIKLGGSLLDWPEWPARFEVWLAEHPEATNVVIVGGGKLVDVVRDWNRTFRLSDSEAHWLSIRAMSTTAELAAKLLPQATLVYDLPAAAVRDGKLKILDVYGPLRCETADGVEAVEAMETLPHGWSVTSDSISAHIAKLLNAEELVLLKSTAAADDLVDEHFPTASRGLNVRIVNLRDVAGTRRVP